MKSQLHLKNMNALITVSEITSVIFGINYCIFNSNGFERLAEILRQRVPPLCWCGIVSPPVATLFSRVLYCITCIAVCRLYLLSVFLYMCLYWEFSSSTFKQSDPSTIHNQTYRRAEIVAAIAGASETVQYVHRTFRLRTTV
jgi:hypothetical protein